MHEIQILKTFSNGVTIPITISYEKEQKLIQNIFINDLINTDIKEIIKTYSDDIYTKYFPEDEPKKKYLSIIISYNVYNYHRPSIFFDSSDFTNNNDLIESINTKIGEYQIKLDEIWRNFLNTNNIM